MSQRCVSIASLHKKEEKHVNFIRNQNFCKSRENKRKETASCDYSKITVKGIKHIKADYSGGPDSFPMALSLSTKYANMSTKSIRSSLKSLKK